MADYGLFFYCAVVVSAEGSGVGAGGELSVGAETGVAAASADDPSPTDAGAAVLSVAEVLATVGSDNAGVVVSSEEETLLL